MSASPPLPNTPQFHYPKWAALVVAHATWADALEAFKTMARRDSTKVEDEQPLLPARNGLAGFGKPIKVRFDLSEPKGDHDHCLFKADEDEKSRKYAGQRRPQDYRPERAECINFIPEVLYDPDEVWIDRIEPWLHIYIARTGPDAYYMILIYKREHGEPRFRLLTAYPVNETSYLKKRKSWKRVFTSNR